MTLLLFFLISVVNIIPGNNVIWIVSLYFFDLNIRIYRWCWLLFNHSRVNLILKGFFISLINFKLIYSFFSNFIVLFQAFHSYQLLLIYLWRKRIIVKHILWWNISQRQCLILIFTLFLITLIFFLLFIDYLSGSLWSV